MKIDPPKWQAWLSEALAETFEAMAFAEIEPCDPQERDPRWLTCSIDLVSPIQGTIHLSLPLALASELTWAAAGTELPEGAENFIHDAVGEFLNTIAGRFLNKVLENATEFRVGLPVFGKSPMGSLALQVWCRVNQNALCIAVTECH